MNKYTFSFIANLFEDLKADPSSDDAAMKIKNLLNNEINYVQCLALVINNSTKADAYYGMIVYPKIILDQDKGMKIESYVIEIQKQMLDILTGQELAAMLIHDIGHNILTTTVIERLKYAVYNICKMTHSKIIDILYNTDGKMRDLAVLDIANRTYKERVVRDLDIFEADRILIDMDIEDFFNSALDKINAGVVNGEDMSNPESQNLADTYIANIILKMVREKYRGLSNTYNYHKFYVDNKYDTKVLKLYPHIDIKLEEEIYGEKVSEIEFMKPYELAMLKESTTEFIKSKKGTKNASYIIESIFKPSRPSITALQKELDVITFKAQSIGTNYERLALLDRIYDNIFILEKYLEYRPDDEAVQTYYKKFIDLPIMLKDLKPTKKQYQVFVEYPEGYVG
jgi:hypothetical protein